MTTRDALLPALDDLVETVRQHLGEHRRLQFRNSTRPCSKNARVSFEALRAYSQARYAFDRGKSTEAIPLLQRAIEIDPNFAIAYADLSTVYANQKEAKLEIANITKAYALRDNASELDKLYISMRYDASVTGDIEETIRVLKTWTELYPNAAVAWANLANEEIWIGEYAPAIRDGKQARSH